MKRIAYTIIALFGVCLVLVASLYLTITPWREQLQQQIAYKIELTNRFVFITIYPNISNDTLKSLFGDMLDANNTLTFSYQSQDGIALVFQRPEIYTFSSAEIWQDDGFTVVNETTTTINRWYSPTVSVNNTEVYRSLNASEAIQWAINIGSEEINFKLDNYILVSNCQAMNVYCKNYLLENCTINGTYFDHCIFKNCMINNSFLRHCVAVNCTIDKYSREVP